MYATVVPKKAKPVVTAPVGKEELLLEANPTWVKEPLVGTMYMSSVSLKETVGFVVVFG